MIVSGAIRPTDHLIHIGPQKTGSTAIQTALFRARDRLLRLGVYYPRHNRRRARESKEMFRAVDDGVARTPLWDALVEEVATEGAGRRVCVSDERFGKASLDQAARVVDDLGGGRPEVVAVARAYDRFLPSQWQQRVKTFLADSYEDWLRHVLDPQTPHSEKRNVWHAHDTRALVERWTRLVDPDRFTVVIGDEDDRDRLPRTFESLLDLPEGVLETHSHRSNKALSLAQVEMLRAVNARLLDEGLPWETYLRLVRHARKRVRRTVPRVPLRQPTPNK